MTPSQTDSFVPLTTAPLASPGKRADFKATVVPQAQVQQFQSAPPPAAASAPVHAVAPAPRAANCEPRVNIQRDGNRVTGIQVQCSCGEVIQLACDYETVAAQPAAAPQPATIPQPAAEEAAPGKICKDSGKDLPTSASKKPKVPEKGSGTSAAKRRSA